MSIEQPYTDTTPQTQTDSYQHIRDNAEDASLRKRVAAHLALSPSTTAEIAQAFEDKSLNAIRPRVNELIRMACVVRKDKRTNPSGHEAYVHHVTPTGKRYLAGDVDPTPNPPLSELQSNVVEIAREYCSGDVDEQTLQDAVDKHDTAKHQRNPEWTPKPMTTETNTDDSTELTDEQRKQIKADPVLQLSDFQ